MSVPFFKKQFSFSQPDGTSLVVVGSGDQHHAVFQTLDGFTVTRNPTTGFYEYARVAAGGDSLEGIGVPAGSVNPRLLGLTPGTRAMPIPANLRSGTWSGLSPSKSRWRQRRERRRVAMRVAAAPGSVMPAPPQSQTVGAYIGLCLPVRFPDVPDTIAATEIDHFCNQQGYAGFGNNGSVCDYFAATSVGKVSYKVVVAPYYTTKHPRAYYTNPKVAQPIRAIELIREALDSLKGGGFDFSKLTVDDESYVYATNVFYAGPCINNWAQGLWPHSHHLSTPYALAPNKKVFDYQITDIGSELTLGTFCHENGHMICDFPDLYDYGYESSGVGAYSLMCSGPNVSPKNPPHVDAYLKYCAGWAGTVTPFSAGGTGTLKAGTNDFLLLRKSSNEYYIIENRDRSGRDAELPDSGLAIWHADQQGDNSNEKMTLDSHYELALVQADGRNDLEHGQGQGDAGDLFKASGKAQFDNGTTPNSKWWDGSSSGLSLHDIGPAGSSIPFKT
jgi:M6 family metalloprotease-like protein